MYVAILELVENCFTLTGISDHNWHLYVYAAKHLEASWKDLICSILSEIGFKHNVTVKIVWRATFKIKYVQFEAWRVVVWSKDNRNP